MAPITEYIRIRDLSVEERIVLVQDIWDTIAEDQGSLELTDAEKEELDRRMETYDLALEEGVSWEYLVERLKSDR